MKLRKIIIALFILPPLLRPAPALAVEPKPGLQLHGFLSQGYLDSSGNNFLADSREGTFSFNEIGVNINGFIHEKLRFGAQLLSKKMGDYGDNDIRLDWALGDYRVRDWAGVRLGKVKIPVGLYNTERDSDFLRPMIFLPQSIYDETRRDTWLAHWGGELYGTVAVDAAGDFDYNLFYGRIRYDEDSVFHDATLDNINTRLADNQQSPQPDPTLPPRINDWYRDSDYLYGASLIYSPPVENLRLGISYAGQKDTSYGGGHRIGEYRTNSNYVLSLEYGWRDFSFSAEYAENDRTQTFYDVTVSDGPNQAWYLMLTYAASDRLSFSVLYDEYWKDKYNKSDSVHASGRSHATPWRKDWGAGMRYDINENWTLKGEWHTVDGTALLLEFFNPDGTERYWQYGAVKVSYNF